jgi:hypothetical protein
MRETQDALDSLFGPYDFLDSGLAGTAIGNGSERMSESPEDRSPNGDQKALDADPAAVLPGLDDFEPARPPPPPEDEKYKPVGKQQGSGMSSEGSSSQAAAPAPKRGRGAAPAQPPATSA